MDPASVKSDDTKFVLRVAKKIEVEQLEIIDVIHLGQHRNENDCLLTLAEEGD